MDADADGDGTADAADACPADARKVEPGRCGCGVAETPDCGDVRRCQSGLVVGITLDSSGSVGTSNFETAREQVSLSLFITKAPSPLLCAPSLSTQLA